MRLSILAHLGIAFQIIGAFLIVPSILALFSSEPVIPFLFASLAAFLTGSLLTQAFKREELSMGDAMALSSLGFLGISLFGAIPYLFYPEFPAGFLNAYFESISGFTTTGLSILPDPSVLPGSLLVWRSLTQWIGGLGVTVLFLSVLLVPGSSSFYLYKSEGADKIEPSVRKTIRDIVLIYLTYTLFGFLLLLLISGSFLHSLVHIFGLISTGGFSSFSGSEAVFSTFSHGSVADILFILLMFAGATSFALHRGLFSGDLKALYRSVEARLFFAIIFLVSLLLAFSFYLSGDPKPMNHAIFQSFSALTTTGYSNMDFTYLNDFSKMLIAALMVIGGGAGSTAGGLKLVRFALLLKAIPYMVKKAVLPRNAVVSLRIGGRLISPEHAMAISLFTSVYVLAFVAGAFALMLSDGLSFVSAIFESASALGTVGLSLGTTVGLSAAGKLVLILEMWVGRLEIIPALMLVGFLSRRLRRFA